MADDAATWQYEEEEEDLLSFLEDGLSAHLRVGVGKLGVFPQCRL